MSNFKMMEVEKLQELFYLAAHDADALAVEARNTIPRLLDHIMYLQDLIDRRHIQDHVDLWKRQAKALVENGTYEI